MTFLRKNFGAIASWASIVALLAAVPIGLFVNWLGREIQEPIFYVGEKSILVNKSNVGRAPISILDKGGEVVEGNVILTRFYFWNNGKKPIVFEEDVIQSANSGQKEIFVYLRGDLKARILSNSCTPVPKSEYTGFKNELEQIDSKRLRFTFNVVRHLEGASCQIIYEGAESVEIDMEGALLDVPGEIDKKASLVRLRRGRLLQSQWKEIGGTIAYLLIGILFLVVALKREDEIKRIPDFIMMIFFFAMGAITASSVFTSTPSTVDGIVPESLTKLKPVFSNPE
ncbi:MAG: hypothetical protein AAGI45_10995 [Cyanobacteria bacterium P01_H01_bin.26]